MNTGAGVICKEIFVVFPLRKLDIQKKARLDLFIILAQILAFFSSFFHLLKIHSFEVLSLPFSCSQLEFGDEEMRNTCS
jgi:hypothetical protein